MVSDQLRVTPANPPIEVWALRSPSTMAVPSPAPQIRSAKPLVMLYVAMTRVPSATLKLAPTWSAWALAFCPSTSFRPAAPVRLTAPQPAL